MAAGFDTVVPGQAYRLTSLHGDVLDGVPAGTLVTVRECLPAEPGGFPRTDVVIVEYSGTETDGSPFNRAFALNPDQFGELLIPA